MNTVRRVSRTSRLRLMPMSASAAIASDTPAARTVSPGVRRVRAKTRRLATKLGGISYVGLPRGRAGRAVIRSLANGGTQLRLTNDRRQTRAAQRLDVVVVLQQNA